MSGNLRSHREVAEAVANDIASGDPDGEYTLSYLVVGLIHGILALVDELEEVSEALRSDVHRRL